MRDETTVQAEIITRDAAVSLPQGARGRVIELTWSTGAQVRRYSWARDEEFDEALEMEPGAVRLERLNSGAPFLASHRRDLSALLGVVEEGSARVEGGKGYARVRVSERAEVEPVWQDIKAGIIRNVSVGYRVHRFERVAKADRTDGGTRALYRAVDWEPMEISAVAVGADAGAGIGIRKEGARVPCVIEERSMKDGTNSPASGGVPEAVRALFEGDELVTSERLDARSGALELAARMHARERGRMGEDVLRAAAVAALAAPDDEAAQERVRDVYINARADLDPFGGRVAIPVDVLHSWDSGAGLQERLADAMAADIAPRLGMVHEPTMGRGLTGHGMLGYARAASAARGQRGLSDREALQSFVRGGAHGTSDFPMVASVTAFTAQILLARRLEAAPIALLRCVTRMGVSDFRERYHVRHHHARPMRETLEAGEPEFITIDENGERIRPVVRNSAAFSATEELLVNAASGGLDLPETITRSLLEANDEMLRSTIGAAIKSNPLLSDGVAVFAAARGTEAAEPGQVDVDFVSVGRTAGARFTDPHGTPRPVEFAMMLVAPEERTDADKVNAALFPATVDQTNPFSGRLSVLSDPELPGGAGAYAYLVPDPTRYDGLVMTHLDGQPGPRVETRDAWPRFGMSWRIDWPIACSWVRPSWWRMEIAGD